MRNPTDELYQKFDVFSTRTGERVTDFTFTLIPEHDEYAAIALAAYADACADEFPSLSGALYKKLDEIGG